MDISKLLRKVNNLNDYISVTHDVLNNYSDSKIQFNVSAVCALNKIRSIEIEYFNKCGENGAALKLIELILRSPPSKSWGLLARELIIIIRYWLDAIRKHLIEHNNNWWNFLSVLLKFIKEISLKHSSICSILVEQIAECLLDIGTREEAELKQKYKIIQCLNLFCAEADREIRFALRDQLDNYFIKLSRLLTTCGDIALQYSIMETLLRWLLPRQDLAVRREASVKWFPSSMSSRPAIEIFMKRPWQNFFKDARDFLNALNDASGLVLSVPCRKFVVGSLVLVSATDKNHWLDINLGSKCLSMMLESRLFDVLDKSVTLCDALVISFDNTDSVQLLSESSQIVIKLSIHDPSLLYPSKVLEGCDVTIAISSRSDAGNVDGALRRVFRDKYQLLLNLQDSIELSPRNKTDDSKKKNNRTDDGTRFSHPYGVNRRKHSGFIVKSRQPVSWQSPSTASTSSLAMLRERLTAFPGHRFDKEPVSVCALPQLSNVTEFTEPDERYINASQSTLKLRSYGICHKKRVKKSQSDTECILRAKEIDKVYDNDIRVKETQINEDALSVKETEATVFDNAARVKETNTKCISPINVEDAVSCLLVATIGSSDSVINDTLERLPKHKDIHTDNIVDMLARESLNSRRNAKIDSSKANDTEAIENTPFVNRESVKNKQNSTTVESYTEIIDPKAAEPVVFDNREIEVFFAQHCSERDLVISPTLAKKINETSSECSFDFCPIMEDENNLDVIECLNEMVDIVCRDFDKCTEYLSECDISDDVGKNKLKDTIVTPKRNTKVKNIKLKFSNIKKQTKTKGKKKLNIESVKKMSPIIERDSVIETSSSEVDKIKSGLDIPLIRRKRKLYSPKDDLANERGVHVSETEEDTVLTVLNINENIQTPTLATCYKDIEKIKRNSIRKLRERKSISAPSLSPKTKKLNDAFDNLRKTDKDGEKVTLVNPKIRNKQLAVYNYSSDSEDEDFKVTRNVKRAVKNKTTEKVLRRSRRNTKTTRNNPEINDNSTDDQININKPKRTRKVIPKNKNLRPKNEMVDERMRETAPEILNTSLIVEPQNEEIIEPNPITVAPQMEIINEKEIVPKTRSRKNTDKTKKDVKNKTVLSVSDRDNTVSPLPGLIIETMQADKESDESIKVLMLAKFDEQLPDITYRTQNLLSDLDQNNNSPIKINSTDEFDRIIINKENTPVITNKAKRRIKKENHTTNVTKYANKTESNIDILEINLVDNSASEKTIATIGKSPITGHGDIDESPPNAKELKQTIHGRGMETQDLNRSMKDYFDKLTIELNRIDQSSNSSTSTVKISEKSVKDLFTEYPAVSIPRMFPKEISSWLPCRYNSVFGSNQSSQSSIKTRSNKKVLDNISKFATDSKNDSNVPYKSLISPVRLYGEMENEEKPISQDDDYLDRIKSLLTTKKYKTQENSEAKSSGYNLRKQISSTKSVSVSEKSTKRKSSPVIEIKKRKKVESAESANVESVENFNIESASGVSDWLNRNERRAVAESLDLSLQDNLENIMEKLDTTLVEIHHMTSKKFVSMFVETQVQLNELKEQRSQMLKETARDVITEVLKVFDVKFADFDKRSHELDEQFISGVKEKASHLIQEDCKQKRIMVSMLKDDIQAVLDDLKKRRTT